MRLPGRALPVALLVLLISACGGVENERLLRGWERGDRPAPELQVDPGEVHCEWEDVLFLSVRWPLGPERDEGLPHSFVRDRDGLLEDYTAGSFDSDTELPDDAVETGYENDDAGAELWLAADLSTAYLVTGDGVEAWPAVSGAVCA